MALQKGNVVTAVGLSAKLQKILTLFPNIISFTINLRSSFNHFQIQMHPQQMTLVSDHLSLLKLCCTGIL